MTYEEFINEIQGRAFPEGIAKNLRTLHGKRILDGLIELQRWVPYLKNRQYTLYSPASSLYRQGTTIIQKPAGKVKRVSTFVSKKLEGQIFYDPCTREDIDRLTAFRARLQRYPDSAAQEWGMFTPDTTLDKGWRSERGLFCIDKDMIILLPHIEMKERIQVEWVGSKRVWDDSDTVDYGDYQVQVISALENYLRMEATGKDDRSGSDFALTRNSWSESVGGLQLDTKDDTEPELPMEDIGILPRTFLPIEPELIPNLGCNFDPSAAFFSSIWMLCLTNGKYYNLGALLFDEEVVESVSGNGLTGGASEATYETIRVNNLNLQADDDLYYRLAVHVVDDTPTWGFDGGPSDSDGKRICDGIACVNLDIKADENDDYYRLNLVIPEDGTEPVLRILAAPASSETPVLEPDTCTSHDVLVLRDQVTQKCMFVRLKNGQIAINDE